MDYCRACGAEVKDGVQRCPQCGSPMDSFGDSGSSDDDDALLNEVWDLAKSGAIVEAVKRYRESTGCDLRTAKDAIDRMIATGGVAGHALPQSPPTEHLEAEILDIAKNQGKIAAIKRYREARGCGLKDAKEAVDSILAEHGVTARTGTGCATVLLFAIGVGFGCSWGW